MKKRGAERLHWDVSYKEAKHLALYHGQPIFKGLVSATNEVGEIRIQFHVVTDGFDQFHRPIDEFLQTMNAHGHKPTELLGTDNPARDASFFLTKLPGVRAKQRKLDAIASGSETAAADSSAGTPSDRPSTLPPCVLATHAPPFPIASPHLAPPCPRSTQGLLHDR